MDIVSGFMTGFIASATKGVHGKPPDYEDQEEEHDSPPIEDKRRTPRPPWAPRPRWR